MICIQTLGINLSFDNQILLNCLNNLNNHVLKNGSIIFNLSMDIYIENKDNIDNFCKNNYQERKKECLILKFKIYTYENIIKNIIKILKIYN